MSDIIKNLLAESGKGKSLEQQISEQVDPNPTRIMNLQNAYALRDSKLKGPISRIGGKILDTDLPEDAHVMLPTQTLLYPERLWSYEYRAVRISMYGGREISVPSAVVLTPKYDVIAEIQSEVNNGRQDSTAGEDKASYST